MCCRFRLGLEEYFEQKQSNMGGKIAYIDYLSHKTIFPSDTCPVIVLEDGKQVVVLKKWGFMSFDKKLVINAKSETINERQLFKNYSHHRLVIPIVGFFEWSQDGMHDRYYFEFMDSKIYYLACIYDVENNFVVITRDADDEMKGIHNRMPILLRDDEINDYLSNITRIEDIFKSMHVRINVSKCS